MTELAKKKPEEAAEKAPETVSEETPAAEAAAPEEKKETKNEPTPLEKAQQELKEEKEKYLRLAAEYDNFRKRSAREREAIYADVKADTITKLLPVYDNLERALKQETKDEAYRRGVELTMNQLNEILSALGVTPIETKEAAFDPALHNAVMHIEDEALGESVIVEEFQKGFTLGEKVIRFSMVKVAN